MKNLNRKEAFKMSQKMELENNKRRKRLKQPQTRTSGRNSVMNYDFKMGILYEDSHCTLKQEHSIDTVKCRTKLWK